MRKNGEKLGGAWGIRIKEELIMSINWREMEQLKNRETLTKHSPGDASGWDPKHKQGGWPRIRGYNTNSDTEDKKLVKHEHEIEKVSVCSGEEWKVGGVGDKEVMRLTLKMVSVYLRIRREIIE